MDKIPRMPSKNECYASVLSKGESRKLAARHEELERQRDTEVRWLATHRKRFVLHRRRSMGNVYNSQIDGTMAPKKRYRRRHNDAADDDGVTSDPEVVDIFRKQEDRRKSIKAAAEAVNADTLRMLQHKYQKAVALGARHDNSSDDDDDDDNDFDDESETIVVPGPEFLEAGFVQNDDKTERKEYVKKHDVKSDDVKNDVRSGRGRYAKSDDVKNDVRSGRGRYAKSDDDKAKVKEDEDGANDRMDVSRKCRPALAVHKRPTHPLPTEASVPSLALAVHKRPTHPLPTEASVPSLALAVHKRPTHPLPTEIPKAGAPVPNSEPKMQKCESQKASSGRKVQTCDESDAETPTSGTQKTTPETQIPTIVVESPEFESEQHTATDDVNTDDVNTATDDVHLSQFRPPQRKRSHSDGNIIFNVLELKNKDLHPYLLAKLAAQEALKDRDTNRNKDHEIEEKERGRTQRSETEGGRTQRSETEGGRTQRSETERGRTQRSETERGRTQRSETEKDEKRQHRSQEKDVVKKDVVKKDVVKKDVVKKDVVKKDVVKKDVVKKDVVKKDVVKKDVVKKSVVKKDVVKKDVVKKGNRSDQQTSFSRSEDHDATQGVIKRGETYVIESDVTQSRVTSRRQVAFDGVDSSDSDVIQSRMTQRHRVDFDDVDESNCSEKHMAGLTSRTKDEDDGDVMNAQTGGRIRHGSVSTQHGSVSTQHKSAASPSLLRRLHPVSDSPSLSPRGKVVKVVTTSQSAHTSQSTHPDLEAPEDGESSGCKGTPVSQFSGRPLRRSRSEAVDIGSLLALREAASRQSSESRDAASRQSSESRDAASRESREELQLGSSRIQGRRGSDFDILKLNPNPNPNPADVTWRFQRRRGSDLPQTFKTRGSDVTNCGRREAPGSLVFSLTLTQEEKEAVARYKRNELLRGLRLRQQEVEGDVSRRIKAFLERYNDA